MVYPVDTSISIKAIEASGDVLEHHGIKGMKWGVRRFQNADGSLTDAGKRRVAVKEDSERKKKERTERLEAFGKKAKKAARVTATVGAAALAGYGAYRFGKSLFSGVDLKKNLSSIKSMSDSDLLAKISRLEKEKKLIDLTRDVNASAVPKAKKILQSSGVAATTTVATAVALYAGKSSIKTIINAAGADGDKVVREMFPKKK